MTEDEKYFLSASELRLWYIKGDFNQHLTLRHQINPLPFDFLEKIIIDNPEISNTQYFEKAVSCLQRLLDLCAHDIPLEIRQCPPDCGCKTQYNAYSPRYTYHKFKVR